MRVIISMCVCHVETIKLTYLITCLQIMPLSQSLPKCDKNHLEV